MKISSLSLAALAASALALAACPSPTDPGDWVDDPPIVGKVATPGFSIPGGELEHDEVPVTIAFTCATEGASFRYTTDGTEPVAASPQGDSVEISGPTTIRVVASAFAMADSDIAEAVYTVRVPDSEAALSSLGYGKGVLTPRFDPGVFDYDLTVPSNLASLAVSAVALSVNAAVSIDGGSPGIGSAGADVAVTDGATIVVRSSSEDGGTTLDYAITVRAIDLAAWDSGSIGSPAFDAAQWQIAVSADGASWFAVPEIDYEISIHPWKSTDSGATWIELTGAGNRGWDWISCDADGSVAVAESYESGAYYLHVSTDGGSTWRAPVLVNSSSPVDLAMSDDGSDMYFKAHLDVAEGSFEATDEALFASHDSGATWTAVLDMTQEEYGAGTSTTNDDLYYPHVATGSDGTVVVLGGYSTFDYGGIFVSTDSGATWTERFLGSNQPVDDLSLSGDATRLAIVSIFDVEVSTDLGATWTTASKPSISGRNYNLGDIAWSRDGTSLVGISNRQYSSNPDSALFTSTDSGASWSVKLQDASYTLNYSWAVSGDASVMACYLANGIRVTTDSGASWSHLDNFGRTSWSAFGMSRDGLRQVAASSAGMDDDARFSIGWLHLSSDSGATWSRSDSAGKRTWLAADVSDDGGTVAALYWEASKFNVVVSDDSGTTWRAPVVLSGYTSALALELSSDGSVMLLTYSSGTYTYLSTDGGTAWSTIAPLGSGTLRGSSVSADGQTITVVAWNAVWSSTDGGAAWSSRIASVPGQLADVSDDGRVMASADTSGKVHLSVDGGASWSALTLPGANSGAEDSTKALAAAVSADGRGIAVATGRALYYSSPPFATEPGSILVTMDGGATWERMTGAGVAAWTGIAATEDFRLISAAAREMSGAPFFLRE